MLHLYNTKLCFKGKFRTYDSIQKDLHFDIFFFYLLNYENIMFHFYE